MKTIIKTAIGAALVTAGTLGAVAPAQAHVGDGVAIGAGLLGLGIGAAIASDHPHYRDGGYYAPPPPPPPPRPIYYAPPPVAYYAPPPPPPPAYGYTYVQQCHVVDRWDPYWGRYVQSRRCY